jgi:glycine cleavage system H lipoate-binding protein
MIARDQDQADNERCLSSAYASCPAAKQHYEEHPSLDHCPFLQESLVQYCSAAPVAKYIPYSEILLSPCGTTSHRYCEIFLGIASPDGRPSFNQSTMHRFEDPAVPVEHDVEGIKVPGWLWYTYNHFWVDPGPDGIFHIGIDELLAHTLGHADKLTFVTNSGLHYPTAVVSVKGVDLQLCFPRKMHITRSNTHLRSDPSRLFSYPYTLGWLFEGTQLKLPEEENESLDGLWTGSPAVEWQKGEVKKLAERIHEMCSHPDEHATVTMADGGISASGLMWELKREDILAVFNDVFSPYAGRAK